MRQRRVEEPLKGATVDRWWLELFLQNRRLLPVKWAALQLGMTQTSFNELRVKLAEAGPQLVHHKSPSLVGSGFEDDLYAQFQRRSRPAAANGHDPLHHNSICRRLHAWISAEFHFSVEAEYCATSRRVGDERLNLATYIDILTPQPLSPVYQAWLDFGKWMALPPDRCSVYTYALHQTELASYTAGTEALRVSPEIEALVQGAAH